MVLLMSKCTCLQSGVLGLWDSTLSFYVHQTWEPHLNAWDSKAGVAGGSAQDTDGVPGSGCWAQWKGQQKSSGPLCSLKSV